MLGSISRQFCTWRIADKGGEDGLDEFKALLYKSANNVSFKALPYLYAITIDIFLSYLPLYSYNQCINILEKIKYKFFLHKNDFKKNEWYIFLSYDTHNRVSLGRT